jgi:hypothetical protein
MGAPGQVQGRQLSLKVLLEHPEAWAADGHIACWDPVPGAMLEGDDSTCVRRHNQRCESRARRYVYKEVLLQAVQAGLVSPALLSHLEGDEQVSGTCPFVVQLVADTAVMA